MKAIPILFSAEMISALLDRRKTKTRRIVKPQPYDYEFGAIRDLHINGPEWFEPGVYDKHGDLQPGKPVYGVYDNEGEWGAACPYGAPGNFLWVKEPWQAWRDYDACKPSEIPQGIANVLHTSDAVQRWDSRKRHARFMMRWMSRITLEITKVGVERLQDISEEDAAAEGVIWRHGPAECPGLPESAKKAFINLWNEINGAGSWDANPWVCVIEFRPIFENIDYVLEKHAQRAVA